MGPAAWRGTSKVSAEYMTSKCLGEVVQWLLSVPSSSPRVPELQLIAVGHTVEGVWLLVL